MALDVDAPARALLGAEHADRAVLLEQRDDAARALGQLDALLGVLHGDGPREHRPKRHLHRLEDPERGDAEPASAGASRLRGSPCRSMLRVFAFSCQHPVQRDPENVSQP